MRLLGAITDEQLRRRRIRRRLAELSDQARRSDMYERHFGGGPLFEHDVATCEYCVPVPRRQDKAF